jgi:hypothetical protein
MKRVPIGVLGLLLLAPTLWALDDPKDPKKPDKPAAEKAQTPAEQYKEILKEFNADQQRFFKAYSAAKNQEERSKLQYPEPQKYGKRMLELAEKNPKDPAAIDALAWVVQAMRSNAEAKKALNVLLKDHIDSKQMANVAQTLRYSGSPETEKDLRTIMEKNPHKEVKGKTCLTLAQYLKDQIQRKKASGPGADKLTKEAESLLELVAKDYGDIVVYGKTTLGSQAKGELFEMRHLAIGKEVPEIQGEDIDGKKFKLSDYRGKVVLLDFWGHW